MVTIKVCASYGIGLYATPSTDTVVANVPAAKAGEAAGIYKMSSTLGGSFGLAIPVTVYSAVEKTGNMGAAASIGLLANAVFARLALLAIVTIIPKDSVKKSLESGINEPLEDRESLLLKVAKKIN